MSGLGTEAETLDAGVDGAVVVVEPSASADAGDEASTIRIDTGRLDAAPSDGQAAGDQFVEPVEASPPPVRDAGADAPLDAPSEPEASSDGAGGADSPVFPPDGPAPPALCCRTPCGGGQFADITCGNGPAWTCDTAGGASCSSVRCSEGSMCHWQGASCVGMVQACP